ncbi:inhibin beta chain like protein [Danaus plexippus plexippus]|uniref:Inhibin beta chain like protein n=1 Tax=Danaus plexippus plexippus TaxID=278856 RepID=A0A212FC65_DANPL|nr:inhibin beta chain like protein [Danaus plexippus plexippus]
MGTKRLHQTALTPDNDEASTDSSHFAFRETLNGQRLIEFRLGQEAESEQGLSVAAAELMVRAEATPRARKLRYTLWAFTVHGNSSVGELAGEAEIGGGRTGSGRGWQRVDVTPAARRWAAAGATTPLRLLVDCSGCAGRVRLRLGGAAAARPLLRLRVAARSPRRRRALDCDAAAHGRCCRQTYYVSFRALGWDDWIVAPEGYYANYCRGACEPYLNYHSQVVEAARLQRAACCAPVRFSALSLIYFGADSNIIKRDLPEMVVEECDCP